MDSFGGNFIGFRIIPLVDFENEPDAVARHNNDKFPADSVKKVLALDVLD